MIGKIYYIDSHLTKKHDIFNHSTNTSAARAIHIDIHTLLFEERTLYSTHYNIHVVYRSLQSDAVNIIHKQESACYSFNNIFR